MCLVDVIIPTYKPDEDFLKNIEILQKQTIKPNQIIIINTEEKYFEQLIYGTNFKNQHDNIKLYHHSRREFDHANSRNKGVSLSKADFFIMMTQDAVPANEYLIDELLKPLIRKKSDISYARQLPKSDCKVIETYTRKFNYPEQSNIKGITDLRQYGIKTYFCSDVCAAYKRETFETLGGFEPNAIFNEDMIFAAKALRKGCRIAYQAEACVYHSHNYSTIQQFHRNFDNGVSQADHPEIFQEISSSTEGSRMVKKTLVYLWKEHHKLLIPQLIRISAAKWLGFQCGKHYKKIPEGLVMKCTSNPIYWKQKKLKSERARIDTTKGCGRNPEKEGE